MTGRASAAFRLAVRQMAVFPLTPGTKLPIAGSHGYRDGSVDCDAARDRWRRWPDANIGIATGARSRIWVLDVDAQHGGHDSLARLEAEHGALPLTVEATTPSGGRHLYWRWQANGTEIRNSAGRVGPGLDVRGEGGSIVAPPSILKDGRRYRWARNGARGFADAPPWLVALARKPAPPPGPEPKPLQGDVSRYVAKAIIAELDGVSAAAEGTRNETLNRSAFAVAQFVAAGVVPDDWARAQLETRARAAGLDAIEARDTIGSAFRAGLRQPRELPR